MEFNESFMKFIFPDEDIFRIEKDELVVHSKELKSCECIVRITPRVVLIEAKPSYPNPETSEERFTQFGNEVKKKFADSLSLFNSIRNKEYGEEAYNRLPVNLRSEDISPSDYVICLIINGHKLEWLGGILDFLRKELKEVVSQYGLKDSNIKVYNEQIAFEENLIVAFVPKERFDELREPNGNPDNTLVEQWFQTH